MHCTPNAKTQKLLQEAASECFSFINSLPTEILQMPLDTFQAKYQGNFEVALGSTDLEASALNKA